VPRMYTPGDQVLGEVSGRVLRKGLAQDLLLIAHALQLQSQLGDDEKRGSERGTWRASPIAPISSATYSGCHTTAYGPPVTCSASAMRLNERPNWASAYTASARPRCMRAAESRSKP
jgi:hypothetical protein